MLDAKLLDFNYKFLNNLESQRRLTPSNIKMIAFNRLTPGQYTVRYSATSDIKTINSTIFDTLGDPKKCQVGDRVQIENLLLTNQNLPFPNQFSIYNVTGEIRIIDKVRFDLIKNQFYLDEIERFKKLLQSIFSDYVTNFNAYKAELDACYVDPCYVDPYYNCPDIDIPGESIGTHGAIQVTPFDVSVEAGPDLFYEPYYSSDSVVTGLTGATATEGYSKLVWTVTGYTGGATYSISEIIGFESGSQNVIGPTILSVVDGTYSITLSAVYPWGLTATDTRIYERKSPRQRNDVALISAIEAKENNIKKLQTQSDAINNEILVIQDEISQLASQISNLQSQNSSDESLILTLIEIKEDKEDQLSILKQDFSFVQDSINECLNDLAALNAQRASLL